MSENTTTQATQEKPAAEKKEGFFGRLFNKLDASMKKKAEEQEKSGCCCSDGKGDKCC